MIGFLSLSFLWCFQAYGVILPWLIKSNRIFVKFCFLFYVSKILQRSIRAVFLFQIWRRLIMRQIVIWVISNEDMKKILKKFAMLSMRITICSFLRHLRYLKLMLQNIKVFNLICDFWFFHKKKQNIMFWWEYSTIFIMFVILHQYFRLFLHWNYSPIYVIK